ncbi:MAG TPA: immunity protein YezG family protein, partial [Clostridia bacterium]
MNLKNTDAIFQKIANIINGMIPEEWDKVYLYGEILEDVQEGFFYYYPTNSNKPAYYYYVPQEFDIDEDEYDKLHEQLLDNLSELWQEFKNSDQEVW